MKKMFLVGFGVVAAGLIFYELSLYMLSDRDPYYFHIDRCLDRGGCWDGIDKVCRNSEINAQELCDRSRLDGKTLEQRIEQKINKINPN